MISNWRRFIQEFIIQAQLWLFLVLLQWIFRVIMILWFYKKISLTTTFNDILLALFHGFRFDSKIASLFLLFPFFFNLILSSLNRFSIIFKLRLFFTGLGIVLILLASIATLPYFEEFDNQFNFFLFLQGPKLCEAQHDVELPSGLLDFLGVALSLTWRPAVLF